MSKGSRAGSFTGITPGVRHPLYRHGHAAGGKTRTYQSWLDMVKRCTNPKTQYFARYGGRGIRVCERWLHSFPNFLEDMGENPPGTTLDRHPNNDGNYEPGNTRWATGDQQMNNRGSFNRTVTYLGATRTIAEWATETGLPQAALYSRIATYGWSAERALSTPLMARNGRR